MFGDFELKGDFGDSDTFALRNDFARAMMKEANGMAFATALADNEHPIAQLLVQKGDNIRRVFGNELRNMAIPLLFAEREEISLLDFFLRGVKDYAESDDIAAKLTILNDFVKEGRKSVSLFAEVIENFPVVARSNSGGANGLDVWLQTYGNEEYEVGLWGIALLVMANEIVGDEPDVVNELLGGMPDDVVTLSADIMLAYHLMFYEFVAGAEPAIAEMKRRLYNSL